MRRLRHTARALPVAALLLSVFAGCDPIGGERPTIPPGDTGAPPTRDGEDPHAGTTAAELEIRLGQLTKKRDAAMASAMSDVGTCEDLCDLATNICEVAKRLEVIANRHMGNESYQRLKREAQLECRDAMESCTNCVAGFETTQPDEPEPESAAPAPAPGQ